nr:retrovirus-related Pol polyprotein from transposon TNT 1-94 [Tanacetum cinerariifolium]
MELALMAKAFKLNYLTPTNNNQKISSNPRNRQIALPGMNMGQDRQMQMVGVQSNPNRNGNLVAAPAEADLDEIKKVNANCILMANLQQASTLGTQTDKAPIYDSDGSTEVHNYENCYDHEIFNMFTQEEQYTELLEPISKPHQVPHNDNNVIFEVSSAEQSRGTLEQHLKNVEEARVLYDSLYNNLAIEVEKVNTVNRKLRETNAELTTELARYKNQEKCFEISQEKYDKLERCYQKYVYQEQCLSKKVSEQKDITHCTSTNTKFAKQSILGIPPKVGETHALSKPVTSNSIPTPRESKCVKNDKVIAPGMFRINPFKPSREEKHVPNKVKASVRTNPITVSQPPVITKKVVNSDSNGLSSIGVDNTKTRRPQPKSNTKNDRKFLGTVRFRNDHVAAILGFSDLQWGNILITRVYFVEGLGHNLFLVRQFCDSELEVAFRRNACFVRNLEGVDLLKRNRSTNLYTINLHEMASTSPICFMARASSTKLWLWHQRLSHLNFDTINDLAKNYLVSGLPKFKYHKEHLCPSYEQRKSKRASHPPKPVPNSRQRLHLLHMDLCGPMRIASIIGKRYVLVIMDDYSCYTWVHFLRSKDKAPEVIKTFMKRITILLQSPVIIIRTDNDTEFKNQALKEYFDKAARTMLIFSRAPLFLWAEAIATACFTQNRSIIHRRFYKTPYELITSRKPDISFLHVFGALCYPKNDREDIGKLGAKGDIGFFIGYSADSCTYRVYNRRTKKIMESMNVTFDELSAMAFEQRSSKPRLQSMTSGQISSGLDLTYAPSTITTQQPTEGELDLLFEAMYDDYIGGQPSATS